MKQKKIGLLISSILLGIPGITSFAAISHSQNNILPNPTLQEKSSENMIRLDWNGLNVPEIPFVKKIKTLSDGSVELTFNTFVESRSMYNSDTKETSKEGRSISTSNITTDITGVSYVIDTNPTTEPDNQVDPLFNNKLTIKPNSDKKTYLHIKTIDNTGNESQTYHQEIRQDLNFSIGYYRIDNVTDRGFEFYIKINSNVILDGITLPFWKSGNYNSMGHFNDRIERIGQNEFKLYIPFASIGSGSEYVYIGIHPIFNGVDHFIADLSLKLDEIAPQLSLQLSTTDWTNQDITLSVESSDNQNIVEYIGVGAPGAVQKNPVYSQPRVLLIQAATESFILPQLVDLGYDVNYVPHYNIQSLDDLKGYDIVIVDTFYWGIDANPQLSSLLLNAFENGISIITSGNDSARSLGFDMSGPYGVGHTIKNFENNGGLSGYLAKGRFNRFATYYHNAFDNDAHHGISNAPGWFPLSISQQTETNEDTYAILFKTHLNGNKWIHFQMAHLSPTEGYRRAIDEIMYGTMKTRQTYHQDFNISENGTYEVLAEDFSGNQTLQSIKVSNIDKVAPNLSISGNPSQWVPSATLKIKASDNLSGVKEILLPNGTKTNLTTFNYTVTANGSYTFKVIDYAGNETIETVSVTKIDSSVIDISLTAQAKPSENMIRLDWTPIDESTYQVYQKKEGSDEFQTISMTDLSKSQQIQVLNVYPVYDGLTQQLIPLDPAFTTWDGEYINELPQSARLKQWMEAPNNEHPKGYGQGLIKVTPVSLSEFNAYTEKYIKNSDGTWKYDVIMFGSWDGNGRSEDLTDQSKLIVEEFIQDGRGVLFGHDTIMHIIKNFSDLKTYTNMKTSVEDGIEAYFNYNYAISSNNALKLKPGLLTNFPWLIEKDSLDIPISHTNLQFYCGDTWYEFNASKPETDSSISEPFGHQVAEFDGCRNNSYLSTWNNTAMIQTGHSKGQATPDEQKILANTLFYLNQLSDANYLNDYSGQDVKGPEKPSIKQTKVLSNDSIELTFNPFVDQGSIYEYYVTATRKDGNSTLASNVVSETITTGVTGVSYVIDTNPDTEPDNQIDALSNNKLTVQPNHQKTTYLHVKAIDQAGNTSETLHYSISIPKINTAEQRDTHIYVNWDIEIPQSSIFWNEDFESKYLDFTTNNVQGVVITSNGTSFDHWGNPRPTDDLVRRSVRIIDGVGIDGTRGVIVTKTIPNNGWDYTYYGHEALPLTGTDISTFRHDGFQQLKVDRPAIARFSAKGDGYLSLSLSSEWTGNGVTNQYNLTWAENLSSSEFENALITSRPIKVNNPTGSPIYNLHLTTAFDYNNSFNFKLAVGDVIQENGSWVFISRAWYGSWADSIKPGQYVTPTDQRTVESISIGQKLSQLQGSAMAENSLWMNSSGWTKYSMNLYIPNTPEINAVGNYFRLSTAYKSANNLYLDNLQIAYAPLSRLYRDGKLIHEGYTVEYTDEDVQDLAAPEKVIVSADYINGNLQLTWPAVQDKGTLYTYEVSGVDENGMESLRSEPKTVEFTSGVKEYRIYLNGTLIETTPDLSYQFDQTITSSDRVEVGVVDHAGNESKTQLNLLNLTAQAKPSENMIRLDWTKVNESTYQVYQKKEGSDKFESIGRSLEPVKVLNVYPSNGNSVSFTTWDGENVTLSEGGLLKKWMEEPNAEHAKGYGQGLIKVTPVDFSSFNQNPSTYLKQTNDGKWNYDVVMVGSWDCNGDCANNNNTYFSSTANQLVNEYIQDGYGLLIGHDFRSFTNKVETEGIPAVEPVGSDLIKITKKGVLTNFPWNLGEVGTILNIPYAHNAGRYVEPFNIWMQFEGNNDLNHCSFGNTLWCRPDKFWHTSTNNHYLSIKNNVAMIQTGHSSGKATSDEQKVLANTLFFLKQISEQNYLNDYSGQDVKGPETPSIKSTQSTTDGFVELTFNPFVDQGSTYEYYVKASPKNGSSNAISPIVTETITTGVAGVSYVIDTNPKTEPDDQLDVLTNNKLKVKLSETQTSYVHLKVIDQAGNSSETLHIPISVPPVLRSEVIDNTYVRLDWAVDILPENVLWAVDYESAEQAKIDLVYRANNGLGAGGQFFDNREHYKGNYSVYTPITIPDKGNNVYATAPHNLTVDRNHIWYRTSNIGIPNNTKISASFRLKTTGNFDVRLFGGWQYEDRFVYYNSYVQEDYPAGTQTIKVSNPEQFDYNNHVTFDPDPVNHIDNNAIDTVNLANGTITLQHPTKVAIKKGDQLKQRPAAEMFTFPNISGTGDNTWQLYNSNTTISDPVGIDWTQRPQMLRQEWITSAGTYLDDLKIGYATKVKLYRDNQIIYEGYDAFLNDLEATDKMAPEGIDLTTANLTATPSQTNSGVYTFNFDFKRPTDQGSTYQYQISSVNAYGMESLKSNPASETVTSGIKGYSYLIDTHPTTDPDTIIDLAADQRQISYTGSGTRYLHIKVIDEAGNVSKTQHIKLAGLELTAQAKPSENMIRLDWTDLNESTYQVYQKKEGDKEFQSISATDLSNVKQVQVLNIYPYRATDTVMTNITFNTWDGEHLTLPKSAALKMWMEQPVSGYPKGYGMGKIEVTAVSQPDFNQNPERYLKNTDGSWKYDVIVNGFWDVNANNDYTQASIDLLRAFVKDGKGYLVGHDTLLSLTPYVGRLSNSLRDLVNIKFPQDLGLSGDSFGGNDYQNGTQVSIRKKGLLTNYPHEIGEIGTSLTIPKTHNSGQMAYGDIWLDFTHHTGSTDSNKKGNSNHYLTTWNNVAMIQTGHSTGEATPDEQKILANTLFYLNQLSVENYLDDHSGQDVKAPAKPSVSKAELLPNGFIELQFNELIDQGSTYEYYVKATHKSGYEQVSNTVKETITTGIKGVSYVIDTHPNTEPDDQVNAFDNNTLQIKLNPSQTTYLHIKVIDQAGNASETLHYVLDLMTLTAQAKPAENGGKGLVRLDWTNKLDHTYQVYQKKEGLDEFQSIGTTNFNTTKQVRVLNVYPLINVYDEPYTTWDGEFVPSQPKSAVLKEWMEKPNAEDSKGYGKGLIKVHPITFDQFNQDPMSYLKDTNGNWSYDVIMFGSADSNMHADLNQESYLATKEFLDSGRGVLFGHDTLTQWFDMKYLPMLSSYANVATYPFTGYTNDTTAPCDVWTMPWSGGTQVELVREGLFNTYPWKIGGVGEILTVPYTHTNSQVAKGDVWLKFTNPHPDYTYNVPIDPNEYSDNGVGTNMAYLTTWNNAAMIQTGHAINRLNATPDEQKIMANTLFYLNQLSSENWLDDYSGQDFKAPETPSIKNHTYRADSLIELSFDTVTDNGSLYEYYVKATHKNGSGIVLSNIASATVTTGLKGYSWIADSNPDTIPDEIIEQTNNQNIQIPTNNQGPYYFHIKAIDKAGNASETFHYELTDTTKPTFTLTPNPTDWTNQDVIIMVDAYDSGTIPSGIKEIILPDGNKVSGDTATFTAIENGTYTFEVVDFMGNRQTESLTISNIDKIKPTGSIIIDQDQEEFYEEETELHLSMSDILDGQEKLSGITTVEIFDVNGTYSYVINNPTDYQSTIPWVLVPYEMPDGSLKAQVGMTLTDKAGNTTTVYSKEVTIIKVRIDEFHLTDVINPRIYNSQNPFQRLSYPYIPSQELLVGGSFEFEAIYTYPPTANSSWKATYEANIHYIHPTDGTTTIPLVLEKQSVDGQFTARHAIPLTAKVGTEVYLELRVAVYNSSGKLMGEDTFPDPAGTLLKIGEITGDIRELLQFNEIY